MSFKKKFKIITVVCVLLIASFVGGYKYATSINQGYWVKDFEFHLNSLVEDFGFEIQNVEEICIEEVPLTEKNKFQLLLLKFFDRIGFYEGGSKFAFRYDLHSNIGSDQINCSVLFAGDHILAISFEFKEPVTDEVIELINREFEPYNILWQEF